MRELIAVSLAIDFYDLVFSEVLAWTQKSSENVFYLERLSNSLSLTLWEFSESTFLGVQWLLFLPKADTILLDLAQLCSDPTTSLRICL